MKKIFLYITAGALALTSCDLDINENPNYPKNEEVTANLIFPAVENAIADCIGDQMFNYGGFFAQYFEQAPTANQYNTLAELDINEGSDLFNRCYSTLFAGALTDIQDILSKTDNPIDVYVCTVMRAQAYQLLVDNLSDAPYTEALRGRENAMPAWDDGQTIYEGVLAEMDAAEAKLTNADMTLTDPMLGGDVDQWKGYANALRLRMYLRLIDGGVKASEYTNKAKALVAANEFFTDDVTWDVYSDASGQYNPWYDAYYSLGTTNHCAAYPLVSYMNLTGDKRIGYALNKNADKKYSGQLPGAKTLTGDWLGISSDYNEDYVSVVKYATTRSMPIYVFTQSELQFLIAEVQLRFNGDADAAKEAYETAVATDFASREIKDADKFLAQPRVSWDAQADNQARLNLIYKQKWVALFMRDHMEAWSEIRRTDVPALSAYAAEDIFEDATIYTPGDMIEPAVNHIVGGGLAKRVPYPSTARSLNNNTPSVKTLSDRVFWDAK